MADQSLVIRTINDRYANRYPGEVARSIEGRPAGEIIEFLAQQVPDSGAAVLQRLTPDVGAEVLQQMGPDVAGPILSALDPARAASLLARLAEEPRERHLGSLGRELAAEIRALIEYPLDSAGHLMDARVRAFRPEDTIGAVLERLRRVTDRRPLDVRIIDGEGRLIGAIPVQDVALGAPETAVGTLARPSPARVQAMASREEVLDELQTQRVASLPVVDINDHLLGVIRHSALVEAAQEEASVDIQTMVGASKDERALSPASFAVRKRLPWLQINLATAFLAAAVVGLFEDTIARFTALAVLLPVVAGQSGNTGAQALAVTMRGLALREVRVRHWFGVCRKEVSVAAVNGLAVAATTALGVFLWSGSPGLTMVIGVSMVISMVLAGLSGAAIPMLLTSLRQDPAQSSSIILTTVTDVVGFFSFLGIATLLSSIL